MRTAATTLICFLIWVSANAQTKGTRVETKTFQVSDTGESLNLNLPFGQLISIQGWDKPEVKFTANIEINGGEFNDAVDLSFFQSSSHVDISMDLNHEMLSESNYPKESCPEGYSGYYSFNGHTGNNHYCMNVTYVVYVPTHMELKVESINADVEVRDTEGPMQIKSINGWVDLDWNQRDGASFRISTINGELFSNIDLPKEGIEDRQVGSSYRGRLNGGAKTVRLETINSNIYLRKRG